MKKGDKFQLKYAWWDKERPKALPKTGLGEALKAYEARKQAFQSASFKRAPHAAALEALQEVEKARLKAVKLCGPAFQVEKVILTEGARAIAEEEHKLQEYGGASARVFAKGIKAGIDESLHKLETAMKVAEKVEPGLLKAQKAAELSKEEKDEVAALVKAAINAVYFIEMNVSHIGACKDGLDYADAVYFKADPDVAAARTKALGESQMARGVGAEFRTLITDVGRRHDIKVAFLQTQ